MNAHLQSIESLNQIAPHARLWASEAACLSLRFPATGCDACVQACPQQVLQKDSKGFALSGSCEECGRCAAACPTGALALHGFALQPANETQVVHLECQQVPESLVVSGAQRVPCLGGLKTSQLLSQLNTDGNTVHLVDHGWCQDCRSGNQAAHPAEVPLNTARELLGEMGLNPDRISLTHLPLPASKLRAQQAEPVLEHQVSRRGFMRHLVGQAASIKQPAPIPATLGEPAVTDGRARIVPQERLRTIAEWQRLAPAVALPARLFHQISIDSSRCQQHQICAATCPVTALRQLEDTQGHGISFHPQLCIGCGECQRNCPEQALQLSAVSQPVTKLQAQRVSHFNLQRCFDCGHEFTTSQNDNQDEPLCPSCCKSRELGQALFGGMF